MFIETNLNCGALRITPTMRGFIEEIEKISKIVMTVTVRTVTKPVMVLTVMVITILLIFSIFLYEAMHSWCNT